MPKIRLDKKSIFIVASGYITRPITIEDAGFYTWDGNPLFGTIFTKGETVRASNYAGKTVIVRQGKRGANDYIVETWLKDELVEHYKKVDCYQRHCRICKVKFSR